MGGVDCFPSRLDMAANKKKPSRMTPTRKSPPMSRGMGDKIVEIFGTDLRSLALLRIVLAILVLIDLVTRARDLSAH